MIKSWINQKVFTSGNISLMYLSPYVDVVENEDGIIMKRHDGNSMLIIGITSENESIVNTLLQQLKKGITEKELKKTLTELFEKEAENWYHNLVWEGFIE